MLTDTATRKLPQSRARGCLEKVIVLICMDHSMFAASGSMLFAAGQASFTAKKLRPIVLYSTAAVLQTPGLPQASRSGPCFSPVLSGGEVPRRLG